MLVVNLIFIFLHYLTLMYDNVRMQEILLVHFQCFFLFSFDWVCQPASTQ